MKKMGILLSCLFVSSLANAAVCTAPNATYTITIVNNSGVTLSRTDYSKNLTWNQGEAPTYKIYSNNSPNTFSFCAPSELPATGITATLDYANGQAYANMDPIFAPDQAVANYAYQNLTVIPEVNGQRHVTYVISPMS